MEKNLTRSQNTMIAGVCGGIAEYFGWDRATFRLLFLVASFVSAAFPGVLIYLILWIIMPQEKN